MIQTIENSVVRPLRRIATVGCGLAAVACALTLTGPVQAQTPSDTIGDTSIQPSGLGFGAGILTADGSPQFLATTESSVAGHDGSTVSGASAVAGAPLSNFAYLDPAVLAYDAGNPGVEGSAYEFTLTVTSLQDNAFQFTYNFATAEDVGGTANPDFAFFSLTPVDAVGDALDVTTYGLLGSAGDAAGNFSVINDPFGDSPFSYTEGYKTFTTGVLAPGIYVLALGVADANTFDTQSGLYIGSVAQVPEPGATAALLLGGLLGVGRALRRRAAATM